MEDIHKALIDIGKGFKEFADAIVQAWKTLITPLREFCKILKTVEVQEKKFYIPVREIKPNKVILLSKRLNAYYCRNNC